MSGKISPVPFDDRGSEQDTETKGMLNNAESKRIKMGCCARSKAWCLLHKKVVIIVAAVTSVLTIVLALIGTFAVCIPEGKGVLTGDPAAEPALLGANQLDMVWVGDTGIEASAKSVLSLISRSNATVWLNVGDFDYKNSPGSYDDVITEFLGADYALFAAVGNHDTFRWSKYAAMLKARLQRSGDADFCYGPAGFAQVCNARGVLVVASGIGSLCKHSFDHEAFVQDALSTFADDFNWKVCLFHKNQAVFQRGDKSDAVGFGVYEICRKAGAIILTGHDHGYMRTHLISKFVKTPVFEAPALESTAPIQIQRGESGQVPVFVSGLGGRGIRSPGDFASSPWMAKTLSEGDADVNYGAIFCNVKPDVMSCEFRTVGDVVVDRFVFLPPFSL